MIRPLIRIFCVIKVKTENLTRYSASDRLEILTFGRYFFLEVAILIVIRMNHNFRVIVIPQILPILKLLWLWWLANRLA